MKVFLILAGLLLVGCDGTAECQSNCAMQSLCGTSNSESGCNERCKERVAEYNEIGPHCGQWIRNQKGCVGALTCDQAAAWFDQEPDASCDQWHTTNSRPVDCDPFEYATGSGYYDTGGE